MNLTKSEKIQFVYDLIGSFFCAFLLGTVCSLWLNPSDNYPAQTGLNWDTFYISLSFTLYLVFFHLFWKSSFFKRFRLNSLWLFINFFSSTTALFFFFSVREIVNRKFLTDASILVSSEKFLLFLLVSFFITLFLIFSAACFWYVGFIHRTVVGHRNKLTVLNLRIYN